MRCFASTQYFQSRSLAFSILESLSRTIIASSKIIRATSEKRKVRNSRREFVKLLTLHAQLTFIRVSSAATRNVETQFTHGLHVAASATYGEGKEKERERKIDIFWDKTSTCGTLVYLNIRGISSIREIITSTYGLGKRGRGRGRVRFAR